MGTNTPNIMRDYVNPLLLFIITALFAWSMAGDTESENALMQPGLWLLTLCATGCVVNGLLCLARGLAHRPMLAGAVWSMVHLLLGSFAWVYLAQDKGVDPEAAAKYRTYIAEPARSPYTADEAGDCTLTLAATLGKDAVVRRLLAKHPHGEAEGAVLRRAARLAALNGHDAALRHLLAAGVPADAAEEGEPLLIAAVNSTKSKTVLALLQAGADVNGTDADGNTPLLHAARNGDFAMTKLLLEHGADKTRANANGLRPVDATSHTSISELLER